MITGDVSEFSGKIGLCPSLRTRSSKRTELQWG